jgi:hypothetical protein
MHAELRILVGLACTGGLVFFPQQHQRHAFALELLMDMSAVGHGKLTDCGDRWKQAFFKRGVIHSIWQWPGQSSGFCCMGVFGNHTDGQLQTGGNLPTT